VTLDPLAFVVLSLAAYRAARAVSLDSITEPFREELDRRAAETESVLDDKLAELASCGFCSSFWLAGVTYLAWLVATSFDGPVLGHLVVWWGIAGGASLLIAVDSFLLREAPPA